jgi:hypothetical protein
LAERSGGNDEPNRALLDTAVHHRETLSFGVSALGVVNGSGSSGCHYSGFVTPRPSGKNVYNVSLTFAGAPCILAGQQVSGVAVVYAIDLYTMQLVVGLVEGGGDITSRHDWARTGPAALDRMAAETCAAGLAMKAQSSDRPSQ